MGNTVSDKLSDGVLIANEDEIRLEPRQTLPPSDLPMFRDVLSTDSSGMNTQDFLMRSEALFSTEDIQKNVIDFLEDNQAETALELLQKSADEAPGAPLLRSHASRGPRRRSGC